MHTGVNNLSLVGRRLSLGPNLVTNGTFNTDVVGWTVTTGTFTWNASGTATVTNDVALQALTSQTILTPGHLYKITFNRISAVGCSGAVYCGLGNLTNLAGNGVTTLYKTCLTDGRLILRTNSASAGPTVEFDDIVVQEIS